MGLGFAQKNKREREKTQNSGVVVIIEVSSFSSAKDINPLPVIFYTMVC